MPCAAAACAIALLRRLLKYLGATYPEARHGMPSNSPKAEWYAIKLVPSTYDTWSPQTEHRIHVDRMAGRQRNGHYQQDARSITKRSCTNSCSSSYADRVTPASQVPPGQHGHNALICVCTDSVFARLLGATPDRGAVWIKLMWQG